jgi:phosphotransferase system enzyme I (PtsI)
MARSTKHLGKSKKWYGRIISPGIAFGYAHLEEPLPSAYNLTIEPGEVQEENTRLEEAVSRVRGRLEEYLRVFDSPSEGDLKDILSSQLAMLDDRSFFQAIHSRIESQFVSAERAVEEEFSTIENRLGTSRDYYLRARTEDLRGLCQLIRKALLLGPAAFGPIDPDKKAPVYFSANLRPTAVLRARRAGAVAFVTSSTAYTSHAAILLRTSGIPALAGGAISDAPLEEGTPLLVDAVRGELHIHPTDRSMKRALSLAKRLKETVAHRAMPPLEAATQGGQKISLWANIDHPSQTVLCFQNRLTGIGLFRTEFMVLEMGRIPDEEAQFEVYRKVVKQLQGRPVVFRTFDIGGDKVTAGLHDCKGVNPALGICGIRRHLLREPEEFRTQVRAILRAAQEGTVSILLPMVTHVGDVEKARVLMDDVRAELAAQNIPFNPNVRVGAMVEIPSAALKIKEILPAVDFISIGTNDLLQYLAAADRDNPEVIAYHDIDTSGLKPLLRSLMKEVRAQGRAEDVCVCGETASDPRAAKFLVQIGITTLSISPGSASTVRKAIEKVRVSPNRAAK